MRCVEVVGLIMNGLAGISHNRLNECDLRDCRNNSLNSLPVWIGNVILPEIALRSAPLGV